MSLKPDIIARLRFLTTKEGGRAGQTPSQQFGCIFVLGRTNHDCRLLLDGIGPISPGQEVTEVPIKFLLYEDLDDHLFAGQHFELRELRTIAKGTVEAVMKNGS